MAYSKAAARVTMKTKHLNLESSSPDGASDNSLKHV